MSTLPFTADDVIAAFDRHPEIKPIFGSCFLWNHEPRITECCGLSILAFDAGHINALTTIPTSTTDFVARIRKAMGWPGETNPAMVEMFEPECRFVLGFDSGYAEEELHRSELENEDFMTGFRVRRILKDRIK